MTAVWTDWCAQGYLDHAEVYGNRPGCPKCLCPNPNYTGSAPPSASTSTVTPTPAHQSPVTAIPLGRVPPNTNRPRALTVAVRDRRPAAEAARQGSALFQRTESSRTHAGTVSRALQRPSPVANSSQPPPPPPSVSKRDWPTVTMQAYIISTDFDADMNLDYSKPARLANFQTCLDRKEIHNLLNDLEGDREGWFLEYVLSFIRKEEGATIEDEGLGHKYGWGFISGFDKVTGEPNKLIVRGGQCYALEGMLAPFPHSNTNGRMIRICREIFVASPVGTPALAAPISSPDPPSPSTFILQRPRATRVAPPAITAAEDSGPDEEEQSVTDVATPGYNDDLPPPPYTDDEDRFDDFMFVQHDEHDVPAVADLVLPTPVTEPNPVARPANAGPANAGPVAENPDERDDNPRARKRARRNILQMDPTPMRLRNRSG